MRDMFPTHRTIDIAPTLPATFLNPITRITMIRLFQCSLAVFFLTVLSPAQAASIGDPAPLLNIERWIKGTPLRVGPGTNIYVVEFWATWCQPCKESIPHLTELQQKYASQGVFFLGISDEPVDTVTPFVKEMGSNIGYWVAVDTSKRTFPAWMTAYGESGIPHAFIVGRDGNVLWHGFPSSRLDTALKRILDGTFDIEAIKNFETGE